MLSMSSIAANPKAKTKTTLLIELSAFVSPVLHSCVFLLSKFHTAGVCNTVIIKRSYFDQTQRLFSESPGNKLNSPVFIVDLIPEAWSVDHRQLHSHSFLLDIWTTGNLFNDYYCFKGISKNTTHHGKYQDSRCTMLDMNDGQP